MSRRLQLVALVLIAAVALSSPAKALLMTCSPAAGAGGECPACCPMMKGAAPLSFCGALHGQWGSCCKWQSCGTVSTEQVQAPNFSSASLIQPAMVTAPLLIRPASSVTAQSPPEPPPPLSQAALCTFLI
jgi:hypothetical protein